MAYRKRRWMLGGNLDSEQQGLEAAIDASTQFSHTRVNIGEDDQLRFYKNVYLAASTTQRAQPFVYSETMQAPMLLYPRDWDVAVETFSFDTSYYSGADVKSWRRIVITAPTLPVYGDIDGNTSVQVLSDFMLDFDALSGDNITKVTYTPFVRRFYQLTGTTAVNRLDLQVFYTKNDNILRPFILKYDDADPLNIVRGSGFIKLGFRKRVLANPF